MTDFTLQRDPWQQLTLVWKDGRRVTGVEPVRAFPISAPEGLLSICDAEGRELVRVESLAELPAEVREILEEELTRREFVPIVLRIEQINVESDPSKWSVVTDRGPATFFMEDSDNDVRRLGPSRIMLVDTHGIHYLIPDARRLDSASRKILDRYL